MLGHVDISFSKYKLSRVLGKGRFCTAFESDCSKVVKIFLVTDANVAINEMQVLKSLGENGRYGMFLNSKHT
jgi:hypothetical protein